MKTIKKLLVGTTLGRAFIRVTHHLGMMKSFVFSNASDWACDVRNSDRLLSYLNRVEKKVVSLQRRRSIFTVNLLSDVNSAFVD